MVDCPKYCPPWKRSKNLPPTSYPSSQSLPLPTLRHSRIPVEIWWIVQCIALLGGRISLPLPTLRHFARNRTRRGTWGFTQNHGPSTWRNPAIDYPSGPIKPINMVKSPSNIAEVRVSNLIVQVLVVIEVVETNFSKEDAEPIIVERYAGPGFWRSPLPSDVPMPRPRVLRSPPPQH
ncbi:hypothetical protein AMTR_s00039p00108860 [Amborella trichopoda]|uniref:Uncharacterized protein n=1 Tax=Amborella trichopoda TaxID=13333 RepID=U5D2Y7_AMBTC|nr:hypothetical protein AMTR_s00039p00108860 [Amborella trichopoda]